MDSPSARNGKRMRGADGGIETHGDPNDHNQAVGDPYATPDVPDVTVVFGLRMAGQGREAGADDGSSTDLAR